MIICEIERIHDFVNSLNNDRQTQNNSNKNTTIILQSGLNFSTTLKTLKLKVKHHAIKLTITTPLSARCL